MSNLSKSISRHNEKTPSTYFAPPERVSAEELQLLARRHLKDPIVDSILNSLSGWALILNSQRQILAANADLLQALNLKEMDSIIGLRPGELLECVHAGEGPAGCGTSLHCRDCGAVLAILASQQGNQPVESECLLSQKSDGQWESREFRVRTNPITISGQSLLVMVLQDISSNKRREVLERLFFHDVRNALAGLLGWSELLRLQNPNEAARNILEMAQLLSREISTHEILLLAEQGKLKLKPAQVYPQQTLESLKVLISSQELAASRQIVFASTPDNAHFVTDLTLLLRILGNMVKNAMEASQPGDLIQVWFERREGKPAFNVRNPAAMQENIARQVFKRSFSTKGEPGRGLGTFSMKLIGENYLKGKVSFDTSPEAGTTFSIQLPEEVPLVPAHC